MTLTLGEHGTLLRTYLRPQAKRVALLTVLLLAGIGLQIANPLILGRFIDTALANGPLQSLTWAAILFVVIALFQQGFAVGATYLSENVGWSATNALRTDLLLHCLRLDQSFHKARTPGELIERIDGDVSALANFFSQLVIRVFGNLLLLAGVLIVLWSIDWRIGLLHLVFAALVFVTMVTIQRIVVPYWKRARQAGAEMYGFLEERLAGIEDLRSSGAQQYTLRQLSQRLTTHYRAERGARLRGRTVWITSHGWFAALYAAIVVLGYQLFGAGAVTLGTLYLVFFYNGLLMHPLFQLAQQTEDFQRATAGIGRIRELFGIRSALPDTGATSLPQGALDVQFDGVQFGYEQDTSVLHDLAFHLRPGRVLGLLGRTGSGKTTLTRLLFRLYDPQSGAIRLNDVDLRQIPLKELRRSVGIVTQDVQLFNATVRDNLTLFDQNVLDERIFQAIAQLGLTSWFKTLPQGLDTMLASGGGLSAGEAQLLAFTRIFLRNPGLVILDEASSRLDPATEQLIEQAIDHLLTDRTGIIIAHRLHTVHRADEIMILDRGGVAEYGERTTLLRDPQSRFACLLQTGLEEVLA